MRLTALGRSAAQWSRRLKICSSTCRTSRKESQPCACTGSQRAPRLTMRGRCRWAKEQSTAECHNSSAGSSERRIVTRSAMRRLQKARHVKALSPGPISPTNVITAVPRTAACIQHIPHIRIRQKMVSTFSKYWYCGIGHCISKYWSIYWSILGVAARKVRY